MPKAPPTPPLQSQGQTDLGYLILQGIESPRGSGNQGEPQYPIGQLNQNRFLYLIAGGTQSKMIPGSGGLTIRNNADTADNFVVDNLGNTTLSATGDFASQSLSLTPTVNTAIQVAAVVTKTGIPDTTATSMARFTVPNAICSIAGTILLRTAVTAAAHVYDSTRTAIYTFAISRISGGATTLALSAATLPLAATSGTSVVASALTLANLIGANSATQTVDFLVANVGTPAGISESTLYVEYIYGEATGAGPFISLTAL